MTFQTRTFKMRWKEKISKQIKNSFVIHAAIYKNTYLSFFPYVTFSCLAKCSWIFHGYYFLLMALKIVLLRAHGSNCFSEITHLRYITVFKAINLLCKPQKWHIQMLISDDQCVSFVRRTFNPKKEKEVFQMFQKVINQRPFKCSNMK